MDISPQRVRTAEFNTVKRGGLDPEEVRTFLGEVAAELERAQNHSTAMEARARAAVARLQELSESGTSPTPVPTSEPSDAAAPAEPAPAPASVTPSVDESETISRTLLLAQRTADTTVAEAKAEAERITQHANDDATRTLESTRTESERLLEVAREDARKAGEAEKIAVETEVDSLKARRDFLESDVDHLERHLADERSRLREAATSLLDLTEKVPGGLGEVRRPLLSASDDDSSAPDEDPALGATAPVENAEGSLFGDAADGAAGPDEADGSDDGDTLLIRTDIADDDPEPGR